MHLFGREPPYIHTVINTPLSFLSQSTMMQRINELSLQSKRSDPIKTKVYLLFFILFSQAGMAEQWREKVITPEREIEAIAQTIQGGREITREKVAKLADAKIAILDYELLRRDFPILKSLTEAKIDRWVLDQVGYISLPQTQQTLVNSQIPIVDGVMIEILSQNLYRGFFLKKIILGFGPIN